MGEADVASISVVDSLARVNSGAAVLVGDADTTSPVSNAFNNLILRVEKQSEEQLRLLEPEKVYDEALAVFEEKKLIERFVTGDDGELEKYDIKHHRVALDNQHIVCDIGKLRGDDGSIFYDAVKRDPRIQKFVKDPKTLCARDDTMTTVMARLFGDQRVLAKSDWYMKWKDTEIKLRDDADKLWLDAARKPLVYVPENDASLNVLEAKTANYHMGLWELPNKQSPELYPTKDANSSLKFHSVSLLHTIFNHQYGDAPIYTYGDHRNIKVRFGPKLPRRKSEKISYEFFQSWGLGTLKTSDNTPISRTVEFFYHGFSELTELQSPGLLRPIIDFKIQKSDTALLFPYRKIVGKTGVVMIERNSFTLGRRYKDMIVFQVGKTQFAVLEEQKRGMKCVALFDTNKDLLKKDYMSAWNKGSVSTVRQGGFPFVKVEENALDVGGYAALLSDPDSYMKASIRFSAEAYVKLASFSAQDQKQLLSLYDAHNNDVRFWKALRIHKDNGVGAKALLTLTRESGDMQAFLAFASSPEAKPLLVEAAQLYDDLHTFESAGGDIHSSGGEVFIEGMERMRGFAEAAHSRIEGRTQAYSLHDVNVAATVFVQEWQKIAYRMYPGLYGPDRLTQVALGKVVAAEGDQAATRFVRDCIAQGRWGEVGAAGGGVMKVLNEVDAFYRNNDKLYSTLATTTGDTPQEKGNYRMYRKERPLSESVRGAVLDVGAGEKVRMEEMLKEENPGRIVIGADYIRPGVYDAKANITAQANAALLPLEAGSIAEANLFWSVYNEFVDPVLRQQALSELQRVVVKGGRVYLGLPHLEGGEGSWMNHVEATHAANPTKEVGTMEATIAERTKSFYISPFDAIVKNFEAAGFRMIWHVEWRTDGGKPRIDVAFEKI